jgi:hypothetical protein
MIEKKYHETVAFGTASTTTSNLTSSSFFMGANGSGTLMNLGAPLKKKVNIKIFLKNEKKIFTIDNKLCLV